MSKSKPLTGIELIDCAKANAKQGIANAAQLSGYGNNVDKFMEELQAACHRIGVNIDSLSDLTCEGVWGSDKSHAEFLLPSKK